MAGITPTVGIADTMSPKTFMFCVLVIAVLCAVIWTMRSGSVDGPTVMVIFAAVWAAVILDNWDWFFPAGLDWTDFIEPR